MLSIKPIQTKIFKLGDSVDEFLLSHSIIPRENDIVCVTSKIISLSENQIVYKNKISKKELVQQEADHYLAESPYDISLTIKHGLMIPSAGIDESNAEGEFYILYPKKPFESAKYIWVFLKQKFKIKNLGIIITDSHTQPLRRGVTGVALSYWGFQGIKSYIGKPDLFGRELKFTAVHCADALAASAVFAMGESNESKPIALISGADVLFADTIDSNEGIIEPENDLYYSLYKKG